ncbi:MAG: hypothetical protein HC802_11370, partial [Caldilineaceae bacterium]|nr:hypothetical protein [Caldilineaceae bacterium]
GKGKSVKVSSVAVDACGCAMLPASGLKGPLRAWLCAHVGATDKDRIRRVLGYQTHNEDEGLGGKAEFLDAFIAVPNDFCARYPDRAEYWRRERATCIAPLVAIDRHTRLGLHPQLSLCRPAGTSGRSRVFAAPGHRALLPCAFAGLYRLQAAHLLMAVGDVTGDGGFRNQRPRSESVRVAE